MAKILIGLKPETVKRFKETMMYLRLTPQMRKSDAKGFVANEGRRKEKR